MNLSWGYKKDILKRKNQVTGFFYIGQNNIWEINSQLQLHSVLFSCALCSACIRITGYENQYILVISKGHNRKGIFQFGGFSIFGILLLLY